MNTSNGSPHTGSKTDAQVLADCFEVIEQAEREIAQYDAGYAVGFEAGIKTPRPRPLASPMPGRRESTWWNRIYQWLVGWF